MPGVEEEHETQIETKGNGDFNPIKRKVVAIGDSACGKTNLLLAFRENRFRDDYIPTVFENTLVTVPVEHRIVELIFWDTADSILKYLCAPFNMEWGQDDYDKLRPLSYPETNLLLLCFSISDTESFLNIQRKWVVEVNHCCPDVPIMLVACKCDLRTDRYQLSETREDTKDVRFVSREMGESIAERIGAVSYVECSAKTGENIEIVFYQAARASLAIPKSNSRGSNPSGSFSSLPLSIRPNTDALNSLSTTKGRRQKLGSNSTHGNMNKCTLF